MVDMAMQFSQDERDLAAGGVLTIDLAALRHNYSAIARHIAPTRAAAVVKADAYGLGASRVAPAFYDAGCRDFFVAHLGEAIALKPFLQPDATLYVLNGLQPGTEEACARDGILPVLNSLEQIENWGALAARQGRKLPALLQLDTGMSRLGLSASEFERLLENFALLDNIDIKFVISHLASGDEPENAANARQLANMTALLVRLPKLPVAFANSGGSFLDKSYHFDLARPGVALYGVGPENEVVPVLTLSARVIQVRDIDKGAAVGYGGTYVAEGPTRVATIAVGYADGWFRSLSNKGSAFFGDTRLPIIGRVSMDSITLDVSALPEGTLKLGSLVELIGPHQRLEDVARDCDTIPYEILTALGNRYARVYVESGASDIKA
ncbi:alanine racemase [Brucella intermedia]|jgi:alanine racemase|uniref:alanine racemase n=1 Tax=Brucella TaxID=234 RepID=UPI0007C3D9BF|nr:MULTISPECIES: alanine racemase [Brucella/Ochrobactrum group]PJT27541.1 alanine racemase [Ochrobactrum sp. 30A/1000/2015]PJT39084.1 alanine racemase [Ochrobactrum sp. 27A/999/2015]PJT44978.1 alanine racemase [Ochrobactrum sp. 23A/997/2015]KAB2715015.1 alanine racemase [Brucella intermedia]MDL2204191.1 alanine racemase [Brucella intermedia]